MRERLPSRRPQISFAFEWASSPEPGAARTRFIGSLGFDARQRPREVFLHCEKTTSALESVGRDAAILISLLLQHGGSFDEMRDAITRLDDGRAASLVGELLDEIKRVTPAEAERLLTSVDT